MAVVQVPGCPPTTDLFSGLFVFGVKHHIVLAKGYPVDLQRRLTQCGYEVTCVSSYLELRRMDLDRSKVDAVVLDVSLPEKGDCKVDNSGGVSHGASKAISHVLLKKNIPHVCVGRAILKPTEVESLHAPYILEPMIELGFQSLLRVLREIVGHNKQTV